MISYLFALESTTKSSSNPISLDGTEGYCRQPCRVRERWTRASAIQLKIRPTSRKEWAAKMKEVGLIPTDTGQPGGKEVGKKVTHMIAEAGFFEKACHAFLAKTGPILDHGRAGVGAAVTRKKKAASKTKYTCPMCELNA
jgi:hypothetical protein